MLQCTGMYLERRPKECSEDCRVYWKVGEVERSKWTFWNCKSLLLHLWNHFVFL